MCGGGGGGSWGLNTLGSVLSPQAEKQHIGVHIKEKCLTFDDNN